MSGPIPFRVSARTVLQLGVAFYELIKNGVDAGSPSVTVEVVERLPFAAYQEALGGLRSGEWDVDPDEYADSDASLIDQVREFVLEQLDRTAPGANDLGAEIEDVEDEDEFLALLDGANYIVISDEGHGMSLDALRSVYLTIGTPFRVREREAMDADPDAERRVPLGEKGIGRLSAMRLGDVLHIRTGRVKERAWNELEIDWREFAGPDDRTIADVTLDPHKGAPKDPAQCGTVLTIHALRAGWTQTRFAEIATSEFARLTDPFEPKNSRYPIKLLFNGKSVAIPNFATVLFEHAHAKFTAWFDPAGKNGPVLSGRVDYNLRNRSRAFELTGTHLASIAGSAALETLRRVGPFDVEAYWYNRRILTKIESIGKLADVRKLVAQWAGGIAVYRDGFRVHPYAGPGDDWLNLNRGAFSTSGFKLNTAQLIGRARITRARNPELIDQTNREGLRDNPEKDAFKSMLTYMMETEFRGFLNLVEEEIKRSQVLTAEQVSERINEEEDRLRAALDDLLRELGNLREARTFVEVVENTFDVVRRLYNDVETMASAYERGRSQLVHMASVGLMVEVLAHELWRMTTSVLNTVAETRKKGQLGSLAPTIAVMDAQLKTLQKRLRILDPLSTNARQTKEEFELVAWVRTILDDHKEQLERNRITCRLEVIPPGGSLKVKAVRGMIVQILENLLNNSVFWIREQRKFLESRQAKKDVRDSITVTVDCRTRQVRVRDTGPGISSDRREVIFEPFYSTKPQNKGSGLGLFISREVAEYHGAHLDLLPDPDPDGQLRVFVLTLGAMTTEPSAR